MEGSNSNSLIFGCVWWNRKNWLTLNVQHSESVPLNRGTSDLNLGRKPELEWLWESWIECGGECSKVCDGTTDAKASVDDSKFVIPLERRPFAITMMNGRVQQWKRQYYDSVTRAYNLLELLNNPSPELLSILSQWSFRFLHKSSVCPFTLSCTWWMPSLPRTLGFRLIWAWWGSSSDDAYVMFKNQM